MEGRQGRGNMKLGDMREGDSSEWRQEGVETGGRRDMREKRHEGGETGERGDR